MISTDANLLQSAPCQRPARVKVKLAADVHTAAALRDFVTRYLESGVRIDTSDVQLMAWLLEVAREITAASAANLRLADDGHEMRLPERARSTSR